jgi:hypothetical protein
MLLNQLQTGEYDTVEVYETLLHQQGLIYLDSLPLTSGPFLPLLTTSLQNGATELVEFDAKPTWRPAAQRSSVGFFESLLSKTGQTCSVAC